MNKNEHLNLKYANEHLTCKNYLHEINTGFIYREFKKGDEKAFAHPLPDNYLVVVLEGLVRVNCGIWTNRMIGNGEMFLIAQSSLVYGECLADCRLLIFAFGTPSTNCEKLDFYKLAELSGEVSYNLNTLPVRSPVDLFADLLVSYLSARANCFHLHAMKREEFFLCLRYFYTKAELASLFYPILARSQDFRAFVLENYPKVKTAKELVGLSHMSRSVFYDKFAREFGMPAKQWLTEKFLHRVAYYALEPDITVKKLMTDLEFGSLSQFQVYCKRNFGCTPSELILRSANGSLEFQHNMGK